MSSPPAVTVTYYLEVVSSWCTWAEPAWAELKRRFNGQAEFRWKIAMMDATGMPKSRAQLEWFYRRSGTITRSPFMLNSAWFEDGWGSYPAPNLVAEAARTLGVVDDRVRLAIARAGVREGRRIGQWDVAVAAAAEASGLDATKLLEEARRPGTAARIEASGREFDALAVTQRPTFLFEHRPTGDRSILSGVWTVEPLAAVLEAMLADAVAVAAYAAHHGGVLAT